MPTIELTTEAHVDFHYDSHLPMPSQLCPVCAPDETLADYPDAVAFLRTAVNSGSDIAVVIGRWWVASIWTADRLPPHVSDGRLPCAWCGVVSDDRDETKRHTDDCLWLSWLTAPGVQA
jgi:hypothetical protein